jgi:hypothetical protein
MVVPQLGQNWAPAITSPPHFGQYMILSRNRRRPTYARDFSRRHRRCQAPGMARKGVRLKARVDKMRRSL